MSDKKFAVVVNYDCAIGARGQVVSKHKTYALARRAAKASGYDDFVRIEEITA